MTPPPYDKDDMASLMIAQVKVAADDHDGDGLTGRQDEIVFPPNKDRTRIYKKFWRQANGRSTNAWIT
jgi:hypothetical protein